MVSVKPHCRRSYATRFQRAATVDESMRRNQRSSVMIPPATCRVEGWRPPSTARLTYRYMCLWAGRPEQKGRGPMYLGSIAVRGQPSRGDLPGTRHALFSAWSGKDRLK